MIYCGLPNPGAHWERSFQSLSMTGIGSFQSPDRFPQVNKEETRTFETDRSEDDMKEKGNEDLLIIEDPENMEPHFGLSVFSLIAIVCIITTYLVLLRFEVIPPL